MLFGSSPPSPSRPSREPVFQILTSEQIYLLQALNTVENNKNPSPPSSSLMWQAVHAQPSRLELCRLSAVRGLVPVQCHGGH